MSSLRYREEGELLSVDFEYDPHGHCLLVDGESYPCDSQAVWLGQKRVSFWVHREQDRAWVWLDGEVYRFTIDDPRQRSSEAGGEVLGGSVKAQMPGKILQVSVKAGERVSKGQNLLLMESMKMELSMDAPVDGTVSKILVKPEQMVGQGDILLEIEES